MLASKKLDFIIDMVHHNPGEKEFETAFLRPDKLKNYGYNGQAFKYINCAVDFSTIEKNLFNSRQEKQYISKIKKRIKKDIQKARKKNLSVFYHIDLFVLPKKLVSKYENKICDPQTGNICINMPETLRIHEILFDEIFTEFDIDGLVIRVGETYLFDCPFHTGNGAVNYNLDPLHTNKEKMQFVNLLRFLRKHICQKHNKYAIFRTWDCFLDRFHANLDYYLDVTNQIEPHPKLIFSIKHTKIDFFRYVEFNPCLAKGPHRQIIEIQCQREFEGKGAYPNYIAHGVINGFCETEQKKGIKDVINHPLICGVYTWSRGGGWYGPYLSNEIWPDLNAYVISNWANCPCKSEEHFFLQYCRNILHLSDDDAWKFRKLCLLSEQAVRKGIYCEAFDMDHRATRLPTDLWTRDDLLGGSDQLQYVFDYLNRNNLFEKAMLEKNEAVKLWQDICEYARDIQFKDTQTQNSVITSAVYGLRHFQLVAAGWNVLYLDLTNQRNRLKDALQSYRRAWDNYRKVAQLPHAATLYRDKYWDIAGKPLPPGLGDSIRQISENL